MNHHQLSRPAAGCAALLLASAPLLLAPAQARADERTKAQIEHEEATTTPNKAQIEHRESVQRTGDGATRVDVRTPAPTPADNSAAAWQLALSAALGAVVAGGVVMGARQVSLHRHALPA